MFKMKKIILIGLILMIVPFVIGDEAWEFHMDNGTFLVNSSNLYDTKFCTYSGSYGLLCNSNATGGSAIDTKWTIDDNSLINDTGILKINETYLSDFLTAAESDPLSHHQNENLDVGDYNLTVGGGFDAGGISLYNTGNAFFGNDIFIGGDILTVNVQAINGSFLPNITNTYDLGSATYQWKDAYFDGTIETDALTIGGTAISSIYEVQLNNEAGLYAVLSDVTQFIEGEDSFGGEVSGTYDNIVIGNDVLDDQYYDSESDLTTLLDDNYEGELDNEAGLYSALSDVTEFLETNDIAQLQSLTITEDEGTGATLDTAMTFDNAVISQNSTHFCIVGSGSGGTLCVESN